MHVLHAALAGALCFCSAAGSTQQPAPSPRDELVLGMSTALSGPAADLGNKMRDGVAAALAEVERAGGIHGRHLRLVALDDALRPERTGPNVRKLVEEQHVLAIVGDVGTPTAVAALQITNPAGTPFYGAFTGAGLLRRSPPEHWVVNYRASYAEEAQAMVDALVEHAGLSCGQVAFFTQRDAYGDAGFAGGVQALKLHRLQDEHRHPARALRAQHRRGRERAGRGVARGSAAARDHHGRCLRPCAAFIKQGRENGLQCTFLNVSFVGSLSLARELGASGEGVIVTQVVPHFDADLPLVAEYRQALAALDPAQAPDFISLEGYVSTRMLCRALENIEGQPDHESLIRALEGLGTLTSAWEPRCDSDPEAPGLHARLADDHPRGKARSLEVGASSRRAREATRARSAARSERRTRAPARLAARSCHAGRRMRAACVLAGWDIRQLTQVGAQVHEPVARPGAALGHGECDQRGPERAEGHARSERHDASEQWIAALDDQAGQPSSPRRVQILAQVRERLPMLRGLLASCKEWRASNRATRSALPALHRLAEQALDDLRAQLETADGQAALRRAVATNRLRHAEGTGGAALARQIVDDTQAESKLRTTRLEVGDLALACEQVLWADSIDRLANVRDNRILGSLLRLHAECGPATRPEDPAPPFKEAALVRLELALFGRATSSIPRTRRSARPRPACSRPARAASSCVRAARSSPTTSTPASID